MRRRDLAPPGLTVELARKRPCDRPGEIWLEVGPHGGGGPNVRDEWHRMLEREAARIARRSRVTAREVTE